MATDFDGAVYICNLCLEEMARIYDYITPELYEKIKEKVGRLEADVFALTKKESGLEVAISGLVDAGYSRDNPLVVLDRDGTLRSVLDEASSGTGDNVGEGEGTTPEPSNDEGVDELRANDGADESAPFELNL